MLDISAILTSHQEWLNNTGGCRANLSDADLHGANLRGTGLSDADLHGADLHDADLNRANLHGANLTGANLTGVNLTGADLRDAKLSDTNLRGADLHGANLTGANLSGANLTGAYLRDAKLSDANLSDTNLRGTYLHGANLTGANLSGAQGILDPIQFLEDHFTKTENGFLVYKTFGDFRRPNQTWTIAPNSVITEIANTDRSTECGSGVNVATLEWVEAHCRNSIVWECLIEWAWLPGVVVPYHTDGKIRASRVRLLKTI